MMLRYAILFLCAVSAFGEIVPAARLAQWRGNVGVEGGIPDSSTMTISATITDTSATAATINSAINTAASGWTAGSPCKVVKLGPGTFSNVGGRIILKSGVVLKGSGQTSTILAYTSSAYGAGIFAGDYYIYAAISAGDYNGGSSVNWTSGYSQGTSNIVLSSVSGLTVGNVIILDQLNDTAYVNTLGYEDDNHAGRGNGARAQQHMAEVQAINGTTVTIWPPLAMPNWSGSLTPQAWWVGASSWTRSIGVEDLTIDGTSFNGDDPFEANIYWETVRDGWLKNVKSKQGSHSHFCVYGGMNIEVRHSYFTETHQYATLSYGITPIYLNWALFEDNAFEKITTAFATAQSSGCSAILYNVFTNAYFTQSANFLMAAIQFHGAHGNMWLIEGNWIESTVSSDFIHGSTSHGTIYRNRIQGYAASSYPSGATVNNLKAIDMQLTNRVWSSAGNILGRDSTYSNYEDRPGSTAAEPVIYQLGMVNTAYGLGWPNDSTTYSSFYRHMDYDFATDSLIYDSGNADHTLVDSYAYASKPTSFGSMAWPPYNPASVTTAAMSYTNLPAGYRLATGGETPQDSGSSTSSAATRGTVGFRGGASTR